MHKGTSWFSYCYLNIQHISLDRVFLPKASSKVLEVSWSFPTSQSLRSSVRSCPSESLIHWQIRPMKRRLKVHHLLCARCSDLFTSQRRNEEESLDRIFHWQLKLWIWFEGYTIFCLLIFMLNLWLLINYISGIFEWLRHSLLVFLFLHYGEKGILLTF